MSLDTTWWHDCEAPLEVDRGCELTSVDAATCREVVQRSSFPWADCPLVSPDPCTVSTTVLATLQP